MPSFLNLSVPPLLSFISFEMSSLVVLLIFSLISSAFATPIFCHFYFWSVYRASEGHFEVTDIDPYLCTHVSYSHYFIDETTFSIKSSDHWTDFERNGRGVFGDFVELKKDNPDLKLMISVGGWAQNPVTFSRLASNPKSIKAFVDSVLNFVNIHNLDGVDISWRHPNDRGGTIKDKMNFVKLLKALKTELEPRNLVLTADIYCTQEILRKSYLLKEISDNVDFIFARMHHYNHPWNFKTGPSTPLRNIENALDFLIDSGVPPWKIAMGFFTFGTIFVLQDPLTYTATASSLTGLPSKKEITKAGWSEAVGETGFNEVCWNQTQSEGWIQKWDGFSQTPFTFKDDILISYDNELSFRKKCDLLLKKGLGGAVVWTIDQDDFKGLCQNGNFPLISEIKQILPKDTLNIKYEIVNSEFESYI